MSLRKFAYILACLITLMTIASIPSTALAGYVVTEKPFLLRFVDQAGQPLKNAYVEIWNETANELIYAGTTNEYGWLNITILVTNKTEEWMPFEETKYNITVLWDPAGTKAFKVYEAKDLTPTEFLAHNYTADGTVGIVTSVLAINFTAYDLSDNLLKYYTTTFEYNYTDKVYSVSGLPSKNITAQIPYDVNWGLTTKWTVRVYWDYEYLRMKKFEFDEKNVTDAATFDDKTYANFTLNRPTLLGPVQTLPEKYGWLKIWVEVCKLTINLKDWFGNSLTGTTSGYSVTKVSINDKKDPSKLLATVVVGRDGTATIEQFPNVSCTLTVYWLSHEVPVQSKTIYKLNSSDETVDVTCKLVKFKLILKDKRPTPQALRNAKVKVVWPNLIEFSTRSDESDGVIQLPPLKSPEASLTGELMPNAGGYLPFGDTKITVYWSITPEDPASWVKVKEATITVSGETPGSITVKVDGEEVSDEDTTTEDVFDYTLVCEVYDAHLTVVDLNGKPLPYATVVLEHPTGAISMVTASPDGSLTLVQVPGGAWRISVVYKNLWLKPFGMTNVFNVSDNIYSAVQYKFGFVNANLRMVKWATEDHGIAGLNVTLSWTGNATITGETGTWKEDWITTNERGFANFTQIPVDVDITIEAYTIHEDEIDNYPHFAKKANIYVGPYEDKLVLGPEDYTGVHHVYIYDFKAIFCDVTGEPLPEELPYTNMTIASMDFEYGNTTKFNSLVFYSINGSHLYIGGEKYEFKAYWAGVRVLNGTITIPLIKDPTVEVPEAYVKCKIYPVSFELYNWKHTRMVNDYKLNITVSWLGMNMTSMSIKPFENVSDTATVYEYIWGANGKDPRYAYLYNVSIITPDETVVYLPVWEMYETEDWVEENRTGLPIIVLIEYIPGVTKDVPEDAEVRTVGFLAPDNIGVNITVTTGDAVELLNETWDVGLFNFTGKTVKWRDLWVYDEDRRVFDIKVTAYDMVASVVDWLGKPYEGFTVKVYWRSPLTEGKDVLVATSTTGADGNATFPIVFWGNETTYYFEAYKIPKPGEIPEAVRALFKLGKDIIATEEVNATKDDLKAELAFNYYIGVQMLSSTGRPLYHVFGGETKRALVYAVRHTEVDGVEAGTIAAYGWTDEHGYVYLAFAKNLTRYTIRAIWLGVNVYDSYEKEVMYKTVMPSIFYTAFTDVYDVSFRLIDDVDRALPGIKYTFVGSAPIDYKIEGTTGPDGTFTAILVPKGDYHISAVWMPGEISILDTDMTIDRNFVELPIRCKVYDAELVFTTKRGTPLSAATVTIVYPDGHEETRSTDKEGKTLYTRIPVGDIEIKSVTWMGRPITVDVTKVTVDKTGAYYFTATNVYLVTVKIYGARGQGLGPSTVSIAPVGIEVETDESGVATVELPAGSYSIHVNYKGIEDEKSVDVAADTTIDFRLDVFATILGRPFRTAEFFGELILLPAVVAIIIYLVAYEYYAWRRRRVTVVPPSK